MNVDVHIERVSLDGVTFTPAERALLARSLSRELTRLIESGGLPGGLVSRGHVPTLTAGTALAPFAGGPAGVGRSMAHAVYASFGRA